MQIATDGEFAPSTTYLNTASHGLPPARSVRTMSAVLADMTSGRIEQDRYFDQIERARAAYARIAQVPASRVATGTAVAVHVSLIAAALPSGARVLTVEGEFSSVVTPFAVRPDLVVRAVPLDELAQSVTAETDLVAVSSVQSADGRTADLPALVEATRVHGARTLIDTTQSTGWLPLAHGQFDYTVCGAYKWLLCPRGTSFLTVPEDGGDLRPLHAGWLSAARPWESTYDPVTEFADTARRFDEPAPFLPYLGAVPALELVEELGPAAIGEHNRALGKRFRAGSESLGIPPIAGDGAIVSLPGVGEAGAQVAARAGVDVSVRAGNLRAAFHLYNTEADVDRLLNALAELAHGS